MGKIVTILLLLLSSIWSRAGVTISLNSQSYDCSTGIITFSFHIENRDDLGATRLGTIYNVNAVTSSQPNTIGDGDITFTGTYPLGEVITISAYDMFSDPSTATNFQFVGAGGAAPPKPSIGAPAMPLCNGASAVLRAFGSGGSFLWSTGATTGSFSVSTAGSYTVTESNACGSSPESNPEIVTTATTPGAPTVSNDNGTTLCNGGFTDLSASPSFGGSIWWSTGQNETPIRVTQAGTYTAFEVNSCGTGASSDPVVITTANTPPAPTISSSNGTILCNGISTNLSTGPSAGGSIQWSTGASGNSVSVSQAGSYFASEVNSCGSGPNSNTIVITAASTPPAPTVTPGSQLLCNGASVTLSSTGSNITWSNAATGNTLITAVAGSYYSFDNNVCGNSPNSNVSVITTGTCTPPTPGTSYQICPGAHKTLDAGAGYDSYLWSDGETTQTISVGAGNYSVTVTKSGCSATSAAVTVSYFTVTPPTITPSGPTTICAGSTVALSASSGSSYLWNTGSTSNSISVSTSGNYSVTVTDGNGCSASSAAVSVTVNPLATATVSGSTTVCQNSANPSIMFTASGGTAPYTFSYIVNGGFSFRVTTTSGNSVTVSVPTTDPGSFTYALQGVQESSSTACVNAAGGSATVVVNALPTASASGSTSVCQDNTSPNVTFTASGGSAPYTFTYTVNGGSAQTISTNGNSVVISAPTNVAGSFTYAISSVQDASGCISIVNSSATVTVNPKPSASIAGTATVCQNSANPSVTFTGAGAAAPYTFTYRLNNGSDQTITTASGGSVTISVPTTTAGTFVYTLLSVQESGGCASVASGSATITVNPLASASFAGSTSVCQNSSHPSVTFTGSGGTAPYTFTYNLNGGSNQTISTASGNSISLSVPTSTPGSFVYTLVDVRESSGTACISSASGTATIVVNPLPTATISGTTTVCQGAPATVTFTGNAGTAPFTFSYSLNGGAAQSSNGSIAVPTSVASTYVYTLTNVVDNNGCSNAASGGAVVTVNPAASPAHIVTSDTHLCNGETGILTVTNFTPGFFYAWYKDGVFFRMSNLDTLQNYQPGSLYVTAITDKGCVAPASNTIVITTGSISQPIITGYKKVCPDGKTMLALSSSDFDSYKWTAAPFGNTVSSDSSYSASVGQYQVWVSRQGCADSTIVAVTLGDTAFPRGSLVITPSSVIYGSEVMLAAEVTGAVIYQWNTGNDSVFTSPNNTVLQNYYTASDSIPVSVVAISERNCKTSFSGYLKVSPASTITIANNSFTGNLKDWNVFPTPFHDHLKVSVVLVRAQPLAIDLFTADGKWVRQWTFPGAKGENLFDLDVSGLTPNITYLIASVYNNAKHSSTIYKY